MQEIKVSITDTLKFMIWLVNNQRFDLVTINTDKLEKEFYNDNRIVRPGVTVEYGTIKANENTIASSLYKALNKKQYKVKTENKRIPVGKKCFIYQNGKKVIGTIIADNKRVYSVKWLDGKQTIEFFVTEFKGAL